jgi:type II pantothenate kinase
MGIDAGASLAKLAVRTGAGELRHELLPAADLERVVERVRRLAPARVGLTGCAASALVERVGAETVRVNEFAAWGSGAAALLARQGARGADRHLLVSVGTGTSVMRSDGMSVSRIGGTALGGGTVMGLGALLLGCRDFDEIAELARRGDRRRVDLLVSDIYRPGEIALTGDLTASSFGKLSRQAERPAPEDLAHAIMGLVGENVALLCGGLGIAQQVERIVFGGTTLRANPALRDILEEVTRALGRGVTFLEDGEFAGAVGALALAADGAP